LMAALSSARRALRAVTREDHASETGSGLVAGPIGGKIAVRRQQPPQA
jgi:hypothetical protein